MKPTTATILANAALLIVYFAAGKFGLSFFGLLHPSASAVWLPTGIALAALLLGGLRLAPAVFAGAFLVNVTTAGSVLSSLGVALGNTLEGVVAVLLLERFAGGRLAFSSATGIMKFMALAAFASTTVSATIGVASLAASGLAPLSQVGAIWFTWWLGDAAGAVLVTPLVLLWWMKAPRRSSPRTAAEEAALLLAVGAVGAAVFFLPTLAQYPLAFLCLAPLVWGALRCEPRVIATAIAVLGVVATAATATARGPFAMLAPNESLLVLQAFLILLSMTALPMAALTAERRAALDRERAARAEALAAPHAKDEFLAILSHELRNPLAAITTAAAVLDAGNATAETSAPLVATIRRQTQHLARLIDDLLDIGRLTAGKLTLRKEPLDLAGAVRRCVDALASARGLAAGRIELDLAAVWIEADPVRLAQMVENLVGNALKHTPPGKRIRVTVREVAGVAELAVEDQGLGIAPDLLPNVFEAFAQGRQGLDRSAGGLGLGLTLVRRIVELHGGTVEAQSDGVDRGSRFVLRFPRSMPPTGVGAVERARAAAGDLRRRLLVVEDNVDARQTLRMLLQALGHEVHEAGDGEAAIAAAAELRPDVAIVDIGLPRLDGYEVARRLRAAHAAIRLVALTGYGQDDDVQRALSAGFDQHLLKPASIDQLRAAIAATSA